MDSSNSDNETLQECEKSKTKTGIDSLPAKSRDIYLKAYESFMEWRATVGAKDFSEPVLLAYFKEQAKKKQASTLWVTYSMLRATLSANNNVHINGYSKVLLFLKSQAKGHKTKKSKIFTAQNVETFLEEAPDEIYLAIKVALIFGISGACRAMELIRIKPSDVVKHTNQAMLVNLFSSSSPAKLERSFVIRDEYVKIVEKYQALRPPNTDFDRFFINYQQGKCTRQAIGKHKLSEFPKRIAQFLNLPNPETYTGHCLRRTSASLLAQSGADAVLLKQCGGWKSTNGIAEYLEGSYIKRVRRDPPRIMPQPIENLQAESLLNEHETQQFETTINETQQFESMINETQQFESTINETQQFESTINETQQFESTINETQQFESTINENQHFESTINETQAYDSTLNNTQQSHTQWSDTTNNTQQINQWSDSLIDQQVTQQGTQQESMLNDTGPQWSESDDSRLVKPDDPFDLIPEKYVMPPSPPRRSPRPAPRRPALSAPRVAAALERRQLRLDEVRARQLHAREVRRLRLEARRVEVDRERNEVLKRIADVALLWIERLSR